MGRKITGNPKFDHIQLAKVTLERKKAEDTLECVITYLRKDTGEQFGSVVVGHGHLSKNSKELLAKLCTSIEDDAAVAIFREDTNEESTRKEGIHAEPTGIVDGEREEATQV